MRLLAFILAASATVTAWPEHALEPAELARACERREEERAAAREKLWREMDDAIAQAKAKTDAQLPIRRDGDLVLHTDGAPVAVSGTMRVLVQCIERPQLDAGTPVILAEHHGELMQCWLEPK